MKAFTTATALAMAICGMLAQPVVAQGDTEVQVLVSPLQQQAATLVAVANGEADIESVFDPAMLAAVPPEQLRLVMGQLLDQHGPAVTVERVEQRGVATGEIVLRFERALVSMNMAVDPAPPHLITGLRITDVQALDLGADAIEADLAALNGQASAWFGPLGGEAAFAYGEASAPYAIGSTFKLYVLSALAREIAAGERAWDDIYRLNTRSLPSGDMRDWPQGAPITLHTLATLMISESDNTATDAIIDVVGRDAVEAEVARTGSSHVTANVPFLKTNELFRLKTIEDGDAYAAADPADRRVILADMAARNYDPDAVIAAFDNTAPTMIDQLEWFASVEDTAKLLQSFTTSDMAEARAIMAVNTVFERETFADWQYVGYKGGSEPGVLNLTWLLQDRAGSWHMLTLHWNDPETVLDEAKLVTIAQRILALD